MKLKSQGRCVDGVLLLDKPVGITSNTALQKVKQLYDAHKAGHTGSLDPLACGMLPICLGQATKFSQFLLEADKSYRVISKLGIKTTTGDSEGKIIEKHEVKNIPIERVAEILQKFHGDIKQVPSMYSAIKYKGRPLYKLAREGITVKCKPRTVTIYKLELLSYEKDLLELEIYCSKGTYIRTLVEDIGKELKCGAYVVALRRLECGAYLENQLVTLQHLEDLFVEQGQKAIDCLLLSVESIVAEWPKVELSEAAAYYIRHGQAIISPYNTPSEGKVCLKMKDGRFLGVGKILEDGKIAPCRLINL
jgi:tRNA pseudouridine55 synthase